MVLDPGKQTEKELLKLEKMCVLRNPHLFRASLRNIPSIVVLLDIYISGGIASIPRTPAMPSTRPMFCVRSDSHFGLGITYMCLRILKSLRDPLAPSVVRRLPLPSSDVWPTVKTC